MKLLIDGYNLLKKIKKTSYINEADRTKFIKQLNNYAHTKKLSIILVFDGGPFTWPSRKRISSYMELVYSGTQQNADTFIKKYLDEHHTQELLLISSDHELVNYAHRYKILSLDSYSFFQFLNQPEQPLPSLQSTTSSQKLTTKSTQELDILMSKLKVPIKKIDAEKTREHKITASKQERKILQKLKKL